MTVSDDVVERAWSGRGAGARALRFALAPAAAAFSTAVRLRALAYRLRLRRGKRLAAGVVSIGNLTVGGTGKTPTTLWAAERLSARGRRPAILSRGYGGSARAPTLAGSGVGGPGVPTSADWKVVGDENVLLARRFGGPVLVARRRAEAGEIACRTFGADTLVLDDGFQHLALARDFDLVCLRGGSTKDAAVLPAGRFREPLSALRRAHAVLYTKTGKGTPPEAELVRRLKGRPLFRGELVPVCLITADAGVWHERPLRNLAGPRTLVVCGIADREPFYRILQEWDCRTEDFLEFPDHHSYTLEDWKAIALRARELDLVVTTEKDLVKLEQFPFAKEKLVAVRVSMEVEDGERLIDLIEQALPAGETRA